MERHEEVFFSLLRSAMWGTPAEIPHDFKEWGRVFNLAKSQSVLALVADVVLSDREINSRFSEKTQEKLRSFMMANMMTADRLNILISKSVGLLLEEGIRPVLLKGQGLASYYPAPNLRQCGDVDLYVGCEDYRKAYGILKTIASDIDDVRKLDIGIHFDVHVGNLEIEVHRFTETYPTRRLDRIYQQASDRGMSEGTVRMDFLGVPVDTPSDDFNAFYIFGHMFRHFLYEGVGYRQICDWIMFLHARRSHIDIDALREMIISMDMLKPWQAFGCLLVDMLGFPKDEFPLYDGRYSGLVGKISRRILDEGNFGKRRSIFTKKSQDYIKDKSRSFLAHFVRVYELFSVFPKHAFRQLGQTMMFSVQKVWMDVKLKRGEATAD